MNDEKHLIDIETKRQLAAAYRRFVMVGLGIIAALLVAVAMSSCKSIEYVPVIEHQTDTIIKTNTVRDSVYLKDSTYVSERGDTVRIERWHTQYIKKEVHDTVYQARCDTVPRPYAVIEYEEKPLTWWQRTIRDLGYIALGAIILGVICLIFKFTRR